MKKTVIVVAGANGAGKTTLARELILSRLPNNFEFLNADLIADGLSPFKPQSVALEAGKEFLRRFENKVSQGESFLVESTLSGLSYKNRLSYLKELGYRIEMIYIWLPNADFAVKRVAQRVRLGGHDVPEQTIRRRFNRSLKNFFDIYCSLAESTLLLDGSVQPIGKIAVWNRGELVDIMDTELYGRISDSQDNDQVRQEKSFYFDSSSQSYILQCIDSLIADVDRFLTIQERESGLPLVVRTDG
jgi:predicted ABC-type ATPase